MVSIRRIEFESLISLLISEHAKMKSDLAEVEQAISKKDFSYAAKILHGLDILFRQHIADEEAQVLRLLIEAYGAKGAEDAIVVFRQHRPIHHIMEEVGKLASLSTEELASSEGRLRLLLEEHTRAEERDVFPRAISTYKDRIEDTR